MSYPWIVLQPVGLSQADEWVRSGFEAHASGNLTRAESLYIRALGAEPNHAIATNNLGLLRVSVGMVHDALMDMERACLFDPHHPVIRANYAFVLMAGDQPTKALEQATYALYLSAPHPKGDVERAGYILSRQALATALSAMGRADDAAPLHAEVLALNAINYGSGIASCFLPSLRDIGPEQALPPRAAWRAAHGWKGSILPHTNDPDPERPLRVGYVSGDFKTHSASMIFSQVLLNHSSAVVPYFYATVQADPDKDAMCLRLMASAGAITEDDENDGPPIKVASGHRWRDVSKMPVDALDRLIRDDEIDVLVDLSGHTNANRLVNFTRKPAPVQVTAWGFAVGTGLPEIDAFFADPITVPEDERQWYAEDVVYLPCIVTYLPPDWYGFPGSSPLPAMQNEYVTFGCFGRFEKMCDEYLATVREVLNRVPNSRAYFKGGEFRKPDSIRRVRDALGVDHSRLLFGMATPHIEHMKAYQQVDLFLDTFPHGMGETVLESTYMGVPTVTLYGKQPPGRLASSIFHVIGRDEWVTRTREEYVEKAVAWAVDPAALAAPRKTLRSEFLESPVINGYVEAVEDAYRFLWRRWCANNEAVKGFDNANGDLSEGVSGVGQAHRLEGVAT